MPLGSSVAIPCPEVSVVLLSHLVAGHVSYGNLLCIIYFKRQQSTSDIKSTQRVWTGITSYYSTCGVPPKYDPKTRIKVPKLLYHNIPKDFMAC